MRNKLPEWAALRFGRTWHGIPNHRARLAMSLAATAALVVTASATVGTGPATADTTVSVTNVEPSSGPFYGGTQVQIVGTGFDQTAGNTSFALGTDPDTGNANELVNVVCASSTSCTGTIPFAPSGPDTGALDVIATADGITSSPNPPGDSYTYSPTIPTGSKNVAYVYDFGAGINDTAGPGSGSSLFVNAVGDPSWGGVPIGTGDTGTFGGVNFTDVPASTVEANPDNAFDGFDTIVLYEVCDLTAYPSLATAVNNFLLDGGKVIIFTADGCASNGLGLVPNYSTFLFPFTSSNPGPEGASGSYTSIEPSSLTAGLAVGPQPYDAIGDANIFSSYNGNWCDSIDATNVLGTSGYVQAYASTESGGLAIYDGEDVWFTDQPSNHLAQIVSLALAQPWRPSGLPCTVSASGVHLTVTPGAATYPYGAQVTMQVTVLDTSGNPVPGATVYFQVTSGPDAPQNVPVTTNAIGEASWTFTNLRTPGTDTIDVSYTDNSGNVYTSNNVYVTWVSPLYRSWPTVGYGYTFPNQGLGNPPPAWWCIWCKSATGFLGEAHLNVTDVLTPAGLESDFTDWARDAVLAGSESQAITDLDNQMNGGLCYGLALSGGRFDSGLATLYDPSAGRSDPVWASVGTGASASTLLPPPDPSVSGSNAYDQQLISRVADDFATQFSTQVNASLDLQQDAFSQAATGFSSFVAQLQSVLSTGKDLYDPSGKLSTTTGNGFALILLFADGEGHAVLAYGMNTLTNGGVEIDVWDNNSAKNPEGIYPPFTGYQIDVNPDGTWTYNAEDSTNAAGIPLSGYFDSTYSMTGAPGYPSGNIDILPLYDPVGLNYYPTQVGAPGSGSLVDVPPGMTVSGLTDSNGEHVNIQPLILGPTTGDNGEIVNFPSGAGQFALTGTAGSLDVRGPDSYMSLIPDSDSPVTVTEDDHTGLIESTGPPADLYVARGHIGVSSTGAGGLAIGSNGGVTTTNDSSNVDLQLQYERDGVVRAATLFSGSTRAGGGLSFTPAQIATKTGIRTPPTVTILNKKATVSGSKVKLRLHCGPAACRGTIKLVYGGKTLATHPYHLNANQIGTFTLVLSARAASLLGKSKTHSANVLAIVTASGGHTARATLRVLSPAVSWVVPGSATAGVPIRFTFTTENTTPGDRLAIQHQQPSDKWITLIKVPSRTAGTGAIPALTAGTHRLRLAIISASGTVDASSSTVVVHVHRRPVVS